MRRKKNILFFSLFALAVLLIGGIYFYFLKRETTQQFQTTQQTQIEKHGPCLGDDEIVDYDRISLNPAVTQPKESSPTILIKNKNTGEVIRSFQIDNVRDSGYPMETHRCGVYFIREFNYDPKKTIQNLGYKEEIWKYDYSGGKKMLILLAEKPKEFISYYSTDFRINLLEHYLALIKGYFGSSDYAIIIKDLKTLNDVFTLPIAEIEKQKPEITQDISFDDWSKDGRYFWADTHYGANTLGFIRIDSQTWKVDLLSAPKDVLGGDALNVENGYITVHPGNVWIGIAELEEQEKAKRRSQGIGTELYIENLLTGDKQFVASTAEPLWYFKPRWLSDTELEYTLPNGEKKMFKINN